MDQEEGVRSTRRSADSILTCCGEKLGFGSTCCRDILAVEEVTLGSVVVVAGCSLRVCVCPASRQVACYVVLYHVNLLLPWKREVASCGGVRSDLLAHHKWIEFPVAD